MTVDKMPSEKWLLAKYLQKKILWTKWLKHECYRPMAVGRQNDYNEKDCIKNDPR